jgi:hypothetical protein
VPGCIRPGTDAPLLRAVAGPRAILHPSGRAAVRRGRGTDAPWNGRAAPPHPMAGRAKGTDAPRDGSGPPRRQPGGTDAPPFSVVPGLAPVTQWPAASWRRAVDARVFARARRGEEQMRRGTGPAPLFAPLSRPAPRNRCAAHRSPGRPGTGEREQMRRGTNAPASVVRCRPHPTLPHGCATGEGSRGGTDAPRNRHAAIAPPRRRTRGYSPPP